MEPYESLANAIIVQAVKDYREALQRLDRHPEKNDYKAEVKSIERFFCSNWYQMLTDLDGTLLMRKIREKLEVACL
ncbi:hypothetical protein ACRQU7_02965 [Caproiciproducens sp. R1]|uniref:hypothetical protein n=1 Tax=Caproiciproducens sp. R1 TaxID=3435000 RepID=UPI004034D8CE